MRNITLISTKHHEVGACNSNALFEILEDIKPDVIFEELPPSLFHLYYSEKTKSNLETNAVHMYLQKYNAVNVPVDIDYQQPKDFFVSYQNAMEAVLAIPEENGNMVKRLLAIQKHYTSIYGFSFINNDDYSQLCDKADDAIDEKLAQLNDEKLNLAYQKWNEFNERREQGILENIYNYSREHNFKKAVLLLGVHHRKAVKEKIESFSLKDPSLDWMFYGE